MARPSACRSVPAPPAPRAVAAWSAAPGPRSASLRVSAMARAGPPPTARRAWRAETSGVTASASASSRGDAPRSHPVPELRSAELRPRAAHRRASPGLSAAEPEMRASTKTFPSVANLAGRASHVSCGFRPNSGATSTVQLYFSPIPWERPAGRWLKRSTSSRGGEAPTSTLRFTAL